MFQSVVRIFATTQSPAYDCPWQSDAPDSCTGSGVVISPGRVLTGAHIVADATFLQVQKVSEPDKMEARVVAINHDADLALLSVADPFLMEEMEPARLGELPNLRSRVSVVGYPVGGEEISITEGVVSRIEVQRYSHSERQLLAVTVDAAINSGNSGGPVLEDGLVVGIAFQTLKDAENIGEMVPSNLIRQFLEGAALGKPASVPGLGLVLQTLENPRLRKRAGLEAGKSGLLVARVEYGSSAWGHLREGDALLSIDGHRIANNGTIQYRGSFRTACDAVLGDHFVGDRIKLGVLRDGREQELELELKPYRTIVPRSQYDKAPTYAIYAGLVFQPLSLDYLRTWGDWWDKAPPELMHHYYCGVRTEQKHEIVVLSKILADAINVGYEELDNTCVLSVNGKVPANMKHFVELLDCATETVEIRLSDDCLVVLDAVQARSATARILERYDVRQDRSADLMG